MISVLSKYNSKTKSLMQVRSADKNYVIGFNNVSVATRVYKRLHPSILQHIYLMKSTPENITQEVNKELSHLGLEEFSVKDLIVDVDAKLVIPKHKVPKTNDYEISVMSRLEYMMLPFERYLGIALADDIERETKTLLIMNCQIIDPCNSYNLFKAQMNGF